MRPQAIVPHPGLAGKHPRLQTRPRRTTDRLTREAVVNMGAFVRHAIKVRRQPRGVAMRAGRIGTLLISEKDNNIGT